MPRKVSRECRKETGKKLYQAKKIVPPHKRRNDDDIEARSTSTKKIRLSFSQKVAEDTNKHFRIIDFLLVFSTISTLVKCAVCDSTVSFQCCGKIGLGFKIKIKCEKCKEPRYVPSSERVDNHMYEVNYRFAFVMRVLGLGLAGCDKFCGLMDLSSNFVSKSVYNNYLNKMCSSVTNAAKRFFVSAIEEEKAAMCREKNIESSSELTVSGDGTWKKRGFSSLYGVASLIGYYTGKVVDVLVKSSYCHMCVTWKNKLDSAEFEEWQENHINEDQCSANHKGASGNMEVDAIVTMFKRSQENNVKIRNYIGDGDSKTYSGVINAEPYGENFLINKKECVGHVQKRMGTRLRDLVKKTVTDSETKTGKKIQKKTLSGKGKLTAKMIDKLTQYYGRAIRFNSNSVEEMKKAIWATYYHYASTDAKPQHENCPSGEDSWCEWQKAAASNKLNNFKHSYSALPTDVLQGIKPIYEDLSKDALLERCIGGFTQNNNESLNQLIWKIALKVESGSAIIVEFASSVAACVFNEGCKAYLTFLEEMGISTGPSCHGWALLTDDIRMNRADERAAETAKNDRIRRRLDQKDALDILDESSILYGPGIDDSM